MRAVFFSFIVLCLALLNFITPASAAELKVVVTIPAFAVELNGKKIDNKHTLHPPLLYKGVTYFPMTSDYAKALGLLVQWNKKTGLTIHSNAARLPLKENRTGNNSFTRKYNAQIATSSIQVNDEKINNSAEKYPILQFRDITYFPMIWHFTHDIFHWNTEWNGKEGFHIWSDQVRVLFQMLYDDANFLYVSTGTQGTYKISKTLDGKYTRVSDQENRALNQKIEAKNEKNALPAPINSDKLITRKGDFIYYKEQNLVSLEPFLKKVEEFKKKEPDAVSGVDYTTRLIKLDDDNSLLILSVNYLNHIPAPYTPHDIRVFVVHQDKANEIAGYTQWPDKLIKNVDGSCWISSYAPAKYDISSVAQDDMLGQLALIGKDGTSYNINQQLKVHDIDVLYDDHQTLMIKAYNDRLDSKMAAKTDGFYTIDTHLIASKIADSIPGTGYAGQNKQVFVLNPDKNSITNVTTKKSHRWWDYELRPGL